MQEKQPPVCSKCGYGNPGNFCTKCGARQPGPQSTSGPGKLTRKPVYVAAAVASVIALTLLALSLLIGNSGAGTDNPRGQADQTEEPNALELATAHHLNHRMAQAFVILGLKYDVDLEYDDLLEFFREVTVENEELWEEISLIEVGLFELFGDEYDYATAMEEFILKQGESPRKVLLQLSQHIASTKKKKTTSPSSTRRSE